MNTNTPVVLYKSELPSAKGRQFVASALLAVSLGVVSLQAGFVLNASAQNNPITSAITSAIVCPQGHTLTNVGGVAVCVSQSNNQNQTQNNNQNNNNTNGSTQNNNTNNPATSPEVSPSPTATPTPVTAPEVNPTPAPTSRPNSNPGPSNGGNSSPSHSGGGAPSCNNEAPKAPRIISAVTSGKNEITLNWEKPASGNVSHYSVAYGLSKNKPLYGVTNVGNVTSFKVSGLAGGVTYYFTVKAVNDCTPSAASNEVYMKVGGKFINTPAQGFSPVLGKTQAPFKANSASKPAISKPVVFNNTVTENKPVNGGLVGKVAGFFKSLFN